ncbi:MAG TPA: HDOD domain-containing protein [Gammaproteobacteria bacterium]
MPDIYVGRQPVYNRELGVYGYELLFRTGQVNAASEGFVSSDGATSTTLINTFLEIGLERLVGKRYAFINLSEQFLLEEDSLPISPQQVILEVLEDVPVNLPLLKAVKRLSEKGFIIALDDYIYNPAHKPLVAMADIIKLDIKQLSEKQLIAHVRTLKKFSAKLLAEKIETIDEYEFCLQLGFDYFQGYFLSRPRIIKSQSLPTNKVAVLNVLSVLQNPDADTEEIEEAISFDVSLSYKMLKLINSSFFGFSREIESIRQAIVLLGRKQLSSWASMIALSRLDDRPSEMVRLAMTRAKMCEMLAEKAGLKSMESYFTAGLFSALDILMERDISDVIKPLPLSEEIVAALLKRQGPIGEALQCVIAYELAEIETAKFNQLSADDIYIANVEAVSWANMVMDI